MNLYGLLQKRAGKGKPVLAGLIGAGKFGSMFLSQARRTKGRQVAAVADLSPQRARDSLSRTGWPAEQYAAKSSTGDSLALGALPIGLAHGIKLTRSVAVGKVLTWADVSAEESEAVRFRHEMEAVYGKEMQEVEG